MSPPSEGNDNQLKVVDKSPLLVNGDNGDSSGSDSKDYLKLLELTLLMPVLSLVKMYLVQTGGSKKSVENSMMEFRMKHCYLFPTIFFLDLGLRLFYIAVVIIVAVRGLGIDQYIKTFCSK